MPKLYCYSIDGVKLSDMDSYNSKDLLGNDAYILVEPTDSAPDNYLEDDTILSWFKHYEKICGKDYKYMRQRIIYIAYVLGWENLSIEEKEIACRVFAVDEEKRLQIYSLEDQVIMGVEHHINSTDARDSRVKRAQTELFNRVDSSIWPDLAEEINILVYRYVTNGREGSIEGDGFGLFDFIDGSARADTPWSTTGLRDREYIVKGFNNCSEFTDYMLDILKNGNY